MIRILFFKLALSGAAAALIAAGASAPMLVSVTVTPTCTVGTPSVTNVTLQCSRSVNHVNVTTATNRVSVTTVGALTSSFSIASAPAPDIRTLGPGGSIPVETAEPSAPARGRDAADTITEESTLAAKIDQPVVVTFNF